MASIGNERDSSDEAIKVQCTTCKGQNKTVEAEKYCVDCQDYYCSSCLKMHDIIPALKGHKLLDKKDGKSDKLISLPTARCDRHNFKTVDMFCENHNAIGCSTCVAVDHRDCKDVFYIPEFIESRSNVLPDILQRMDNVEKKLTDFHKVFSDERNAVNRNKETEIETIERLGKKLKEKIQEATEQAIIKVKDMYETLRGKIDGEIDIIKKKLESFETTKDLIVSSVENKPQSFVAAKLHESKIAETETACLDIERIKLGRRVHFSPNKENDLISKETFSIGNVNVRPHCFVHKGTVNVKLSTDAGSCNIWSSCFIPDGSVVFADNGNKNIKLLHGKSLTVGDHYQLNSGPTDVCYIEKGEICVCLEGENKIKMFRVTDKLLPTYELSLNFNCMGVSYIDNKLYITDFGSNLHEVRLDGQIVRIISPVFQNENVKRLFYICASKNNKNIFISGCTDTDNCVICIDYDGKVLNLVSDKIRWAHGLAETGDGKIFACGYSSMNIILLDKVGEYVRTVIDDGLPGPQGICYDFNRTRLYVSNYKKDEVQIFEAE